MFFIVILDYNGGLYNRVLRYNKEVLVINWRILE